MFGKTKDPVCGMKVTKKTPAATSEYVDKTFYFCSSTCKDKFDQDPLKYIKMKEEDSGCCG